MFLIRAKLLRIGKPIKRREIWYVCNLNRKNIMAFFRVTVNNLNQKPIDFWKLCKPFLCDKDVGNEKILLVKDNVVISQEEKVVNIFNTYFNGITNELDLYFWNQTFCSDILDPVHSAIAKFKNHPSIKKIKSIQKQTTFKFEEVSNELIHKLVMLLNERKSTSGPIPVKEMSKDFSNGLK